MANFKNKIFHFLQLILSEKRRGGNGGAANAGGNETGWDKLMRIVQSKEVKIVALVAIFGNNSFPLDDGGRIGCFSARYCQWQLCQPLSKRNPAFSLHVRLLLGNCRARWVVRLSGW